MLKIAEMCVNLHPNLNKVALMKTTKTICLLVALACVMVSCLKDKDSETTVYTDAAVSSFTLGTLNRYLHTTSSTGADSIYKKTVTGSNYSFHIDQVSRKIFNTDSLPLSTDVSKVVCTIGVSTNSMVLFEDIDSDTLRYYTDGDSIDFTKPRKLLVIAGDGVGSTEYEVRVNAHQQEADVLSWNRMDSHSSSVTPSVSVTMDGIKTLIGYSSTEAYGLSVDGRLMVWRAGATQWEEDLLDDDTSLLPAQDFSLVSYPVDYAANTEQVVLVGSRSVEQYPQEKTCRVWRKIVDKNRPAESRWTYMEQNDESQMTLPRMQNVSTVYYDGSIIAIGGAGIGGATQSAWKQFYQSRDNGITWKYNKYYQLPEGFDYSATKVTLSADADGYLWMVCEGSGQVWRGRVNRLGWEIKD